MLSLLFNHREVGPQGLPSYFGVRLIIFYVRMFMDRREELGRGGVLPTQPPIVLKIFSSDKNVPCFKVDISMHFKVRELYFNVNHNSSLSPVSPYYRVDVADGL